MTYPKVRGVAAAHAVDVAESGGPALFDAVVPRRLAVAIISGSEGLDFFGGAGVDGRERRKGRSQGKEHEEGRQLHLEGLKWLLLD